MASSRRPLSPPEVGQRLRAQFGDEILETSDVHGHAVVRITPERYRDVARFVRDEPDIDCDFFDFLTGVDWRPRGGGFDVVTHLYSIRNGLHVRLEVACDAENPRCPTLSDLWPGANWHEREAWELFGIVFEQHPHLVKLLLPEQFEGHPLRKDFALMTREAKPWPGAVEGEDLEE